MTKSRLSNLLTLLIIVLYLNPVEGISKTLNRNSGSWKALLGCLRAVPSRLQVLKVAGHKTVFPDSQL